MFYLMPCHRTLLGKHTTRFLTNSIEMNMDS